MKAITRNDRRIVDEMAQLWFDNGGDADGITWLWTDIRDSVQELTNQTARANREACNSLSDQ